MTLKQAQRQYDSMEPPSQPKWMDDADYRRCRGCNTIKPFPHDWQGDLCHECLELLNKFHD